MTQDSREVERLQSIVGELNRMFGGQQTQSVTINGNAAALVVSIIAVFAIVVAVACVFVTRAEMQTLQHMRETDMRDMSQIRARLMTLEQYRQQHADRLNELEKRE